MLLLLNRLRQRLDAATVHAGHREYINVNLSSIGCSILLKCHLIYVLSSFKNKIIESTSDPMNHRRPSVA